MKEFYQLVVVEPNFSEGGMMHKKEYYDPWTDLVIAMLSTGGYYLEKTFQHIDALKDRGLTSPIHIASLDHKTIVEELIASGYNRGQVLTEMFSGRLFSLRNLAIRFEYSTKILSEGSREDIEVLLKNVKGIGPFVIDSFLLLRAK